MVDALNRKWQFVLGGLIVVVVVLVAGLWAADGRPAVLTPFDGGMGTESSPWEISTAEQLVAIDSGELYLDGSFVLTDDVDFDEVDDEGFIGIGSWDGPFTGSFDGDGHTVENFSVQVDGEHLGVGLFRNPEGRIEAVEMVGVDIEADTSSLVGSVAGENGGEIIEVRASGHLRGETEVGGLVGANPEGKVVQGETSVDVEGERFIGGLVGANHDGEIAEAEASGDVDGETEVGGLIGANFGGEVVEAKVSGEIEGESKTGGLVGWNTGEAEVLGAEASGDVGGGEDVGGFVGANSVGSKVVAATAAGDVQGRERVGGFVGRIESDASILRSYSTGGVDGDVDVGGFAGVAEDPTLIEDCYWNMDSTGIDTSAGGVGLTNEEFGDPDRFEGFVFCPGDDCRWVMDEGDRRPVLEAFAE